jgi:cytochrome c5
MPKTGMRSEGLTPGFPSFRTILRRAARAVVWITAALLAAAPYGATQIENSLELPDGKGKPVLEAKCSGCHALEMVAAWTGLEKDGWVQTIREKEQARASLTDDDVRILGEYLAANLGPGRKILETACTKCHGLDEVKKFRNFYKRDDWQDIVATMVKYGADVSERQVPVLVDYLATAYSPKK